MSENDYSSTSDQERTARSLQNIDRNTAGMRSDAAKQGGFLSNVSGTDIMKAGAIITTQAYGAGKSLNDALAEGLKEGAGFIRNNVEEIRASYGGFFDDEFEYKAEAASANAMRRFSIVTQTFADEAGSAIMGTEKMGTDILANISDRGNILMNLIGSPAEAMRKVDDLLVDLSTTYGNEINKLSEESVVKMAFYEDALGASAQTLSDIFQKQIAFTGEISTDALDQLGAYANNISKELNIPMKYLTDMTTQIMSNTQMFGDITVEEATRMSAKLTQLGFTYDQLNAQQNKFGSFSGAAQAAGTIAQLTGAQVDAMKMSFLTSEGKFDELIEYQQESLFKAGMTKEKFMNQSNAMRNAIADAFGRSQEEMAVLLDKNRQVSSQEELDRIMKEGEATEQEGFDRLLNNIDQTKNALKTTQEIMSQQKMQAELGMQEQLYKAVEVKEKQVRGLRNAMGSLSKSLFTDRMKKDIKLINDISEKLNPEDFAGNIEKYFQKMVDIGGPWLEEAQSLIERAQGIDPSFGQQPKTATVADLNAAEKQRLKFLKGEQKLADSTLKENNIKVEIIDKSTTAADGTQIRDYEVVLKKLDSQGQEIRELKRTSLTKQK